MLNELVRSFVRPFVPSFGDGGEIFGRGNGIIDFYGERERAARSFCRVRLDYTPRHHYTAPPIARKSADLADIDTSKMYFHKF